MALCCCVAQGKRESNRQTSSIPKMTAYLNHGVKAKICETTPFVNTVGAHYVASRAQIEQACDSLRQQGSSRVTRIGPSKVDVCADVTESPCTIVEALMVPEAATWSTMGMHTHPFTDDILQNVHPCHEVLLSCKPHRAGCHQWRPMQQQVHDDLKELQPDVIVERYLNAKCYHYDPEDIYDMCDYNANAKYLAESDQTVTLTSMETEECSIQASLNDNFQELVNTVPEWDQETQVIHPKWLEHHQSGHLTKDPGCPACMEEAGSKVNHRRKKGDRSPGVMHCDLATFEASADGHKYCLVAAVTIEVDKESKLLPFFVPMPKKDAVGSSQGRSRIARIQADGGGEFTNQKVRDLCWEKNITLSYSPAHQPSSNGMAERMVGMLKTTVRRMLKQAKLGRERWSYACRFAGHMMREKVLGREWPHPVILGQLVGIWKSHDKAQANSLDDRGCVGYIF